MNGLGVEDGSDVLRQAFNAHGAGGIPGVEADKNVATVRCFDGDGHEFVIVALGAQNGGPGVMNLLKWHITS